jgi:hypothetical protein
MKKNIHLFLLILPIIGMSQNYSIDTSNNIIPAINNNYVVEYRLHDTTIVHNQGNNNCWHSWVEKPQSAFLFSVYDSESSSTHEMICKYCLRHIENIKRIEQIYIKREEHEFYQLLKKINE